MSLPNLSTGSNDPTRVIVGHDYDSVAAMAYSTNVTRQLRFERELNLICGNSESEVNSREVLSFRNCLKPLIANLGVEPNLLANHIRYLTVALAGKRGNLDLPDLDSGDYNHALGNFVSGLVQHRRLPIEDTAQPLQPPVGIQLSPEVDASTVQSDITGGTFLPGNRQMSREAEDATSPHSDDLLSEASRSNNAGSIQTLSSTPILEYDAEERKEEIAGEYEPLPDESTTSNNPSVKQNDDEQVEEHRKENDGEQKHSQEDTANNSEKEHVYEHQQPKCCCIL
jgi:hypothetical protein